MLPQEWTVKDIRPFMQKFLVNYLLEKCRQVMNEALDDFLREFMSSYEENWQKFVRETFKQIQSKPSQEQQDKVMHEMMDGLKTEMQIVLHIVSRLPIAREIKHELPYLRKKLG